MLAAVEVKQLSCWKKQKIFVSESFCARNIDCQLGSALTIFVLKAVSFILRCAEKTGWVLLVSKGFISI
jgi:hypothetical protein